MDSAANLATVLAAFWRLDHLSPSEHNGRRGHGSGSSAASSVSKGNLSECQSSVTRGAPGTSGIGCFHWLSNLNS